MGAANTSYGELVASDYKRNFTFFAPPTTGLSRQSTSLSQAIGDANAFSRHNSGSVAARAALGSRMAPSHRSHMSTASLRSKIAEAVQEEVERTALKDYIKLLEDRKHRELMKKFDMPPH